MLQNQFSVSYESLLTFSITAATLIVIAITAFVGRRSRLLLVWLVPMVLCYLAAAGVVLHVGKCAIGADWATSTASVMQHLEALAVDDPPKVLYMPADRLIKLPFVLAVWGTLWGLLSGGIVQTILLVRPALYEKSRPSPHAEK